MVVAELRDHGFPYGSVRVVERPGSTDTRVQLTVAADTGPQAVFGAITIEGDVSVDEDVIRRELAFNEGDLYQLSRITETQRRLYGLELFQFVNITPRLPEDRSPQVPVVVTVAEGKHRRLQLAAGYGSEEKARGRINWRHVNFGGGARTGEVEAKASSLEQGMRGSFLEPFLFQRGLSLRLSGSTWWADEPVYEYRSSGGRVGLSKDFSRAGVGAERGVRNTLSATLIQEYEDYTIAPSRPRRSDVSRRADRAGPRSRYRPRHGHAVGVRDRFRAQHVGAAARSAPGLLRARRTSRKPGSGSAAASTTTSSPAKCAGTCPLGSRFVWANRAALGNAGRAERRADSVLQAVLRRRIEQRPRLGTLSGEPADARGTADRRADDDGGVDRGAIRHSRKAQRRAVRRRRQRVGRPVGRAARAICAGPSARASATTRRSARCASTSAFSSIPSTGSSSRGIRRSGSGEYTSASARRSRRARSRHARAAPAVALRRDCRAVARHPARRRRRGDADELVQELAAPEGGLPGRAVPERRAHHHAPQRQHLHRRRARGRRAASRRADRRRDGQADGRLQPAAR